MQFPKKHTKNHEKAVKRTLKFFVEFCLISLAVFVVFYSVQVFNRYQEFALNKAIEPGRSYVQSDDFSTVVLGEETANETAQNNPVKEQVLQSENYKTKLVTFGGNTALPMEENAKLGISEVRSELLTTRDQEEVKLYVSWKTNKPAVSELSYGKNIEQGAKKIKEDKFGYVHSTILSSLDSSSAYTYRINGKDKWGNEAQSEQFAFYTGAPNISLLDLLLGAFKDVFGWAMKK